jgi:hypothetical protein
MNLGWKKNWLTTRQHLMDWWTHKGLVLSASTPPVVRIPHDEVSPYEKPEDIALFYSDPVYHAHCEHQRLAWAYFGADTLPVADTDIGPGSLALYLGSEPGFSRDTVWFEPCLERIDQPILLKPENHWWQVTQTTILACVNKANGQYMVGCPDLIENVDILAAMRSPQNLLTDLIDHPEAVLEREHEINQAWFQTYSRIYEMIRLEDGSANFGAFRLWGPGKTTKLQCDASAMLSPRMFRKFGVPFLQEQCRWLDFSMYHLDGSQCICHLDALLEIEELDAIEWTANPIVPSGGDATWYPMYRRILESGKSVQIVDVQLKDVRPLLDTLGPRGLYIFAIVSSVDEVDLLEKWSEEYS